MKNLIGIVLVLTGFIASGSGNADVSFVMIVAGDMLLFMGKPKHRDETPTVPPASKSCWSPITNKSYAR